MLEQDDAERSDVLTVSTLAAEAPWRAKLQAALLLFVAAAGTVVGAVAVYFDYRNSAELRAYQAAGTCSAPTDALFTDGCRYTGTALVTGTSQQSKLSVTLSVKALPGHSFVATFPFSREPPASYMADGAAAPAELWNGTVTQFAGVKSAENPEFLPQLALVGWILVVVGLGLIAWGVTLARKAWRR